jgi:PAS domain S-box-containing protein
MDSAPLTLSGEPRLTSLVDALFEEANVGLCLVAPDGRVVRANETWQRITGLGEDDAVGARFVDLVELDRDGVRRALERARAGEVVPVPRRLVRIGNRETFLEGRMSPVAVRDGTAVLVALRDVTSEVTFQIRALEALPNLVWACQADGFCDYLSPQWLDYTGVSFEHQAGEGWLEQVHPDDRRRATDAWRSAVASGTRYEVEYRLRRRDGAYRWHMARGGALRDSSGRVHRWLGTSTDIDAQKRAEARIASLQRVTAALAAGLTRDDAARALFAEGLAVLGADAAHVCMRTGEGELQVVSAHGVPAEDLARWPRFPADERFHAGAVVKTRQPVFLETPEECDRYPVLADLRRATGHGAWACLPLLSHGEVAGVIGLAWNQPRRFPPDEREFMLALASQYAQALERAWLYEAERAARERAEAAEDEARRIGGLQERLLAVVGHDLRTPLQAVTLGAKVLFLRGGLSEQQAATLARVSSSASRMNGIIRDLLDFTRARQGAGIAVARQLMDIEAACRRAVLELQEVHPERVIAVEASGDLAYEGDPERLLQVVSNLVSNAVQYSPPGARVVVALRGDPDAAVVSVHNDGPPIAAELLPTLFEPFRRGHRAAGDERTGNVGLGLFIVHEIVRAHGGRVDVRSTAGEGTSFIVTLPRRTDLRAAPA